MLWYHYDLDIDDNDGLRPGTTALLTEVRFVTAVTASGSVKFLPAVLISPFSLIFCAIITKAVERAD